MARSSCLIFNPAAGQGDSEQELQTICQLLSPHMELEVRLTSPDVDAAPLARTAVNQNFDLIIAAGGDGTVSAVAAALIGTSISLGVIGRGTANAFANALDIPTSLEAACRVITEGTTRVVDAASCGDSTMILLAGIGLEAETIRKADRVAKDRLGVLAYVFAGFRQLQDLELFSAELEIDGSRKVEFSAGAITVANAAPATSILAQGPAGVIPDDGLLDLTIVAPESTLDIMAASYNLLRSALRGEAATQESVGYLRAKHFRITTQPAQRVMIDGELVGHTPIEIACIPHSLTVCTPQSDMERPEQPQERLENLPDLSVRIVD
ncbi:Diacylglycerol kinase [Acaryochloris thomasi RCC1774]|uniref:Diacylglycerol kinase n=1 Tax=Acaryochloris thomasi RCC1774 TaxID=1764569 RepID=A0A2W1JPA5_9CYAN|nr:YegS/Rv2252/BmrU family lipid kinase [Acaryochloris thomasi]PZD75170.1 Diacylglycerol kinase [Acaryochloris thomasi RCC1774]